MSEKQPNPDRTPRLRAGDRDRNRAVEQLEWAFRDGQIDFEELHERTVAAQNAKFVDELPPLLSDLSIERDPAHQPAVPLQMPAPQNFVSSSITGSTTGAKKMSLVAFGGIDRKGPWKCAPQHTAVTAFGGIEIDLTQAELTAQHTVIDVFCAFGGVDIIIPDTWQVSLDVLPIFGGAEVTPSQRRFGFLDNLTGRQPADPAVNPAPNQAPAHMQNYGAAGAQPHITVRGICAFGGVSVERVSLDK